MANLQDVARLAGVSTATVSKVLSNTPYFTEETRRRVMEAVAALNYRPNLAARALASGKTRIIGVVFPYLYDAIFKDPLVLTLLEGIDEVMTPNGYSLLLSAPRLNDESVEDYLQLIQSGYLDGVIAIDSVPNSPIAELVTAQELPLVVIGYQNVAYSVRCDDYQGGKLLIEYLIKLKHRQIGIISVLSTSNHAVNQRLQGILDSAHAHRIDPQSLPIAIGDFSIASGERAILELIHQHPNLTAVICLNDRMALGAIRALQGQGLRVPEDVSIVGYDDLNSVDFFQPALTTVSQHASALGQNAAQVLLAVLNQESPDTVVLEPTLVVRASATAPREWALPLQGGRVS